MVASSVLTGVSLRSAARAGQIGMNALVYTAVPATRQAPTNENVFKGVETFAKHVRSVVSQSEDMGTFNQVEHKEVDITKEPDTEGVCHMHMVVLVATVELGDGFEEEVTEERKEEALCFIDAATGDIFLPAPGAARVDARVGARGNVLDSDAGAAAFDSKSSAMRPFTGTIRELINAGVKVDDANAQGQTALMQAASCGKSDVCEWLVEHGGAQVNARTRVGSTALMMAADRSTDAMIDVCKILLANGADPNLANRWGCTVLHLAALRGQRELAELLLENGTNMNAVDEQSNTPACYTQSDKCEGDTVPALQQLLSSK